MNTADTEREWTMTVDNWTKAELAARVAEAEINEAYKACAA